MILGVSWRWWLVFFLAMLAVDGLLLAHCMARGGRLYVIVAAASAVLDLVGAFMVLFRWRHPVAVPGSRERPGTANRPGREA